MSENRLNESFEEEFLSLNPVVSPSLLQEVLDVFSDELNWENEIDRLQNGEPSGPPAKRVRTEEDNSAIEVDPSFLDDPELLTLLDEVHAATMAQAHPPCIGSGTDQDVPRVNQVGGNDTPTFTLEEKQTIERKKFNSREVIHEITLHTADNSTWKEHLDLLGTAIDTSLSQVTAELHNDDLVRIYISQDGLETPITIKLTRKEDVSSDAIMRHVEKVLQSKSQLQFDESFQLSIGTLKLPRGSGRSRITNVDKHIKSKGSIISITNKDNLCLARAIVVAMAYRLNNPEKKKIGDGRISLQKTLALQLCEQADVSTTKICDLTDVVKFEKALNVQIIVVSAQHLNSIIYKGHSNKLCKIYLYLHNQHFHVISKIHAFFGSSYFCEHCFRSYSSKKVHRCDALCYMCYGLDCYRSDEVPCRDCNRTFKNLTCFNRHKERSGKPDNYSVHKSICETFWQCSECKTTLKYSLRTPEKHNCDDKYCTACKIFYTENHVCYMEPKESAKPCYNFIYFDFEAIQETGQHIPNLVVAQKTCEACIEEDIVNRDSVCSTCGVREVVFQGNDTVTKFCSWLFSPEHRNYTAIAHSLRSYDGVFLLKYLTDNAIPPTVVFNGAKIMFIEISSLKIKVIDSLNHIPTSLSKLPKTFGLSQLRKGYFPHMFNKKINQRYIGCYPDVEYYSCDTMSVQGRAEFLMWYREQEGKIFDFRKEIYEYCRSDVDILRKACLKYRALILQTTVPDTSPVDSETDAHGVDPLNYVTVASMCFGIFRHLFLLENTLARVPAEGIVARDQYSASSIKWLNWVQHKSELAGKPIEIQHALTAKGEKRVGRYRLDGWVETEKLCLEYNGCLFHACNVCFNPEQFNSKLGMSNYKVYKKTLDKQTYLESLGYKVVTKWEHEFLNEMKLDLELREFLKTQDIQERLDPRNAFYGGRVNATRLYCEAEEGSKIYYYDFTSLYPYCCKYGEYPLGYPQIITSNFDNITSYTGFVHARVIPPKRLYIPVLPYRTDKLLFPLCRTCAENKIPRCTHSDDERALTGTWVTFELELALRKGYRITTIYEVYHFPKTLKYDGRNAETGMFSKYINTFLAIKQQASGWPDWCKTAYDKKMYIREYEEKEGIKLNESLIEKNPGLRACAKSILNNFWGKLGQRSGLSKTSFVTESSQFFEHFLDPEKIVEDFHTFSQDIAMVQWRLKGQSAETVTSSNIYAAAFTTAHARVKLYGVLEKLDRRVYYFDTDSIIFQAREGEYKPETGDGLGMLTNELESDEHIVTFLSGGAKNYSFRTNKGREIVKIRGFTLSYKHSQLLNFQTMKSMVEQYVLFGDKCPCGKPADTCVLCNCPVSVELVEESKITRNKKTFKIVNKRETKRYKVCYTKRVVQPDFDTLPYGY